MPLNSVLEGSAQVSVSRTLLPGEAVEATKALDASQNCASKTQNPTEQYTCLTSTKHALNPPQDLGQACIWIKGTLWFLKIWIQSVPAILLNCNPTKTMNLPKRIFLIRQTFLVSLSTGIPYPSFQSCRTALKQEEGAPESWVRHNHHNCIIRTPSERDQRPSENNFFALQKCFGHYWIWSSVDKETNLGECPVVAIFRQWNLGRSPDLKALLNFYRGVSEVEFVAKVAPPKTISACSLMLIQWSSWPGFNRYSKQHFLRALCFTVKVIKEMTSI